MEVKIYTKIQGIIDDTNESTMRLKDLVCQKV